MTSSSLTSAIQALSTERQGLEALERTLQGPMREEFEKAVDHILATKGRLVVTGIGKSGHIGRKIQATLASTGTPSLFVHPSEAAHGDLGMVEKNDIILYLSNSGESVELAPLITHASRLGLTQIALTSIASSTLARAVHICLLLPEASEACPMGLAPTTSCLLQLALGDALAISLLEKRGFSANDFSLLHPAGQLGSLLRPVSDLMHQGDRLPLGPLNMPLRAVIVEMTRKAFGCMGVIGSDGTLQGLISDRDLRRSLDRDLDTTLAKDIMNQTPLTTVPTARVQEVLRFMNERPTPISSLFVINDAQHPLGILHLHDLLRAGTAP